MPVPRILDTILVTDGSHAGVEPTGYEIIEYLRRRPIPGVVVAEMHPEARLAQKRYLGDKEFGAHATANIVNCDDQEGFDEDQQAVRRFVRETADIPYWLGIDPHNTCRAGADSLVIGSEATLESIGCAALLGLENIVVSTESPYHDLLQRFVKVEISTTPDDNPLLWPDVWHQSLTKMAAMGRTELQQLGKLSLPDLNYYVEVEISRVDADGHPLTDPRHQQLMEMLEATPDPGAYFQPIELPVTFSGQEQALAGRQLCVGYWGDDNLSPPMPELLGYRADGRPRRQYFGSLMVPISPPVIK